VLKHSVFQKINLYNMTAIKLLSWRKVKFLVSSRWTWAN